MVPNQGYVVFNQSAQTVVSEEELCRRWARKHGYYLGESAVLRATFFHHFVACARRPAGAADGKMGSQQCLFEMPIPSLSPLQDVLSLCEYHQNEKYAIVDGAIAWLPSRSIDTYFIDDEHQ
eukprot:2812982-Pleurochrysis_carterae.AAC.1